ncbi:MAG: hypothetical protein EBT03_07360 [Betaproteobacteria bacterium]|nr:hypothetical protein [Betaproteobacteria bacterium]NCA16487.1 hypothetical protein [Betaproteobacteria bacterium]
MQEYLQKAIVQGDRLQKLCQRGDSLREREREASDRILHFLTGSIVFQQNQNTVQNIVFNVPRTDDVEATRFALYPYVRRISLSPDAVGIGPSERTFRPTVWTKQNNRALTMAGVDALIEMIVSFPNGKTRSYQNAAWPASQAFSLLTSGAGLSGQGLFDRTEATGGLVFDAPLYLERGSTVTARITPLYSTVNSDEQALPLEYKIVGVLEGYKRKR